MVNSYVVRDFVAPTHQISVWCSRNAKSKKRKTIYYLMCSRSAISNQTHRSWIQFIVSLDWMLDVWSVCICRWMASIRLLLLFRITDLIEISIGGESRVLFKVVCIITYSTMFDLLLPSLSPFQWTWHREKELEWELECVGGWKEEK